MPYQRAAQPDDRQCHQDEHGHHEDHHPDHGADRGGPADRVPDERLAVVEQDPVEPHVERPVEVRVEAHVEEVEEGQQPEAEPEHNRRHPPRPRWQDHQNDRSEDAFHRNAAERSGGEAVEIVGQQQGGEHQEGGQDGEDPRHGRVPEPPAATTAAGAVR